MIHKLMDIFGRKDVNTSNSTQSTESGLEKAFQDTTSHTTMSESMDEKPLSSSDNSNENSNPENLLMYLKSTAKSADGRKDCFGCKVTATLLVVSSVLFAVSCVHIKRKQIVSMQSNKWRQKQVSRNLSLIQFSLVGVCLAFTYMEWFGGNSGKTKSEDTKA